MCNGLPGREEVLRPDKSSHNAGQVFEPNRVHKSLRVRGRCLKSKSLVTGLQAASEQDLPSKPVCGRELAGGLDSRPPPLRDSGFDQHRCARRPKATQGKRVPRVPKTGQPHQSSLISQVFARSPLLRTGQVFPARSGELDKSSVPTIAGWRAGVVGHPSVARRRRPRDDAAPCRDC